jgi:hypothetical protein
MSDEHERTQLKPFFSIAAIRQANAAAGQRWFGAKEMEGFGSEIPEPQQIVCGLFFISSEQDSEGPRQYTIRSVDAAGNVKTAGRFCAYESFDEASEALSQALQAGASVRQAHGDENSPATGYHWQVWIGEIDVYGIHTKDGAAQLARELNTDYLPRAAQPAR